MFLCGDVHESENDYHLVGLNHIVERDPTLGDVSDLEDGCEAERGALGEPWIRTRIQDES
jgi:hypothetical protein